MKKFNVKTFLNKDWKIAKNTGGTADIKNITTKHYLLDSENYITGEETLKRIKESGDIPMNADMFLYFWEHQDKIPKDWGSYIYFFGTILLIPDGSRNVLCLYRFDGRWRWFVYWLDSGWDRDDRSAVSQVPLETLVPEASELSLVHSDLMSLRNEFAEFKQKIKKFLILD